ncbi:hypothetical protein [Candidatus Ruminimicrobium bovinum]|uniref:hypothetical protein n=1 Tax=Candidatus Ruminimicrobium bovinum TaxID=3242779 RepID=UPI0039B9288A
MNKKIIVILLSVVFCSNVLFANFVNSDIAQLNPDPYSQALGGSILSFSPAVFGFFANPANNFSAFSKQIQASYISAYTRNYGGNIGLLLPTESIGNFSFAVGYNEFNKDIDSLEIQNSMMVAVNYVYPFLKEVPVPKEKGSVGITLKGYRLKAKNYDENANLFSMDLGFIYNLEFIDSRLYAAAALKNLGNDIDINKTTQKQLQYFDVSARYLVSDSGNVSIMADMIKNFEITDIGYACGVEFYPVNPLALRVGWRDFRDNFYKGITAGFSFDFDRVNIAYSYTDLMGTDNDQHTFTIGFYFGKIPSPEKAYNHYLCYNLKKAKREYDRKNFIEARTQFENILAVYPDNEEAKKYLNLLNDEWENVESDSKEKIEKVLAKAEANYFKNNLVRAQKYYSDILKMDPDNKEAKIGLEKIEKEIKDMDIYRNRKEHAKEIAEIWKQAVKYYNAGEFIYAKDEFNKILDIDPENSGAIEYLEIIEEKVNRVNVVQAESTFQKGLASYKEQDFEQALVYFRAAYINSPDRQDIQKYIQVCENKLEEVKNTESADNIFDQDAEEPQEQKINQSKKAAVKNKKTASAKKEKKTGSVTNSQIADSMKKQYNLALTQYSQEKDKASLKSFNTLAKMAKKYKYYNYNEQIKTYSARLKQRLANKAYDEGKAFEESNNLEQAFAKYKEAVSYVKDHKSKNEMKRLNSVIAQDLYDQGLQAFSSGKKAKAVELLEKSLEYDPDKTEAKRALERIK